MRWLDRLNSREELFLMRCLMFLIIFSAALSIFERHVNIDQIRERYSWSATLSQSQTEY